MHTKISNSNQHLLSSPTIAGLYISSIWAANYAILHIGTPTPSGVHVIPVWPGVDAPSGVLFAGLTFTLRDILQDRIGKVGASVCIMAGALLSAIMSYDLAVASGVSFLISEIIDFAIYTPIRKRSKVLAVAVSNTFGLIFDSLLFLTLAGIPMMFLSGQVIGKLWMTLLAIVVILLANRRSRQSSEID